MCNREEMKSRMDEIACAVEELASAIAEMEKRDRCRYYCRDRGNHHHLCDYSEN